MGKRRLVIVGAGGQARELKWIAEASQSPDGPFQVLGFVVSDLSRLTERDSRDLILGDLAWLRSHRSELDALAIGIGTPAARLRLATELEVEFGPQWWPPIVHPSVVMDRQSCALGHGVLLCPGVLLTVNITLEPHCMVNCGCTVGHEARIGRGSVVNPGANIAGGVTIGAGCLVGCGAQVLQYRCVGAAAIVGAGAVVTRDVANGTTVVGVPARPIPQTESKR